MRRLKICSAPIRGHNKDRSPDDCPVHGPQARRAAAADPKGAVRPPAPTGRRPEEFDDFDASILNSALHGPNTKPSVLRNLSDRPAASTREGVANHANTPEDVLVLLASDEDQRVRRAVMENPNTPTETVAGLSASEF